MYFSSESLAGTIAHAVEHGVKHPDPYATASGIVLFVALISYTLTRRRRESY